MVRTVDVPAPAYPKTPESIAIGRLIRGARDRVGVSGAELARRVGTSPVVITHVETGHRKASVGRRLAIANALGVPLSDLLLESEVGS